MKWIHKLIITLSITTISLVALYALLGDTRVLSITPDQYNFYATNDQVSGGASTSELDFSDESVGLNCELKSSDYPWPYCGFSIFTDHLDNLQGLDLANYHTIRLKLAYPESGDRPGRLRIYLRNYNPKYSVPDNEYSWKYNGMEFSPKSKNQTIEIPIGNLQVMTWWLADNKIAIEDSAPEYSNITRIEIATGSSAGLGLHQIKIQSIEFEGAYLAEETLLFVLLLSWVTLGLAFSLHELRKSNVAMRTAQHRHQHLEKLNHKLRAQNFEFAELAHRDCLTGAMNRHAVRDWLTLQARQVRWGHDSLTVLYLDLDNFKLVNDQHGHSVGDDILREFAMVVGSCLSADQKLVRWGGEEFIVFASGSSVSESIEIAEAIRLKVAQHSWVHGGVLTCSIGVAEMQNERVTETLARADEALYQAKHSGRNRVVVNYGLTEAEVEAV